jgi:hypothetical protein
MRETMLALGDHELFGDGVPRPAGAFVTDMFAGSLGATLRKRGPSLIAA